MKAALIQFDCTENINKNIEKAFEKAKIAKSQGANIICFSEFFSYPWFPYSKNKDLSLFKDDDTLKLSIDLAKELEVYLVISYYEIEPDIQFNTAALINPEGKIIGKYRKNHRPNLPCFHETHWYSQGDLGLPVFKTEIGNIGIIICSDAMFIQNSQILRMKGAELIFNPRCVVNAGNYRWQKMLIANSITSGCYVFSANRTGSYHEMQFNGHSIAVEPGGEIIKESGIDEDVLIVEYDLQKVKDAQSKYPCIVEPDLEMHIEEFSNLL